MSIHYAPKNFFRHVPNRLLAQYFNEQEVLQKIDFAKLNETDVTPIYDAWLALPEEKRNPLEQDFQEIHLMANEAGIKAILDEANYHEENLTEIFSSFKGFHEHVFWTFLNRPNYWYGAVTVSKQIPNYTH